MARGPHLGAPSCRETPPDHRESDAQAHRGPGPAAFSASWLISNWSLLVSGRRGELRACECIRHGVKHGELCWALCVDLV